MVNSNTAGQESLSISLKLAGQIQQKMYLIE